MSKFEKKKGEGDVAEMVIAPIAPKSKADAIKESRMPEAQKQEYLRLLAEDVVVKGDAQAVSFDVYVKVKKVPKHLHRAMFVFPGAKGVKYASIEQWDQIFKNF